MEGLLALAETLQVSGEPTNCRDGVFWRVRIGQKNRRPPDQAPQLCRARDYAVPIAEELRHLLPFIGWTDFFVSQNPHPPWTNVSTFILRARE